MTIQPSLPTPVSFRQELGRVVATPCFQYLVATALGFLIFFARAPGPWLSPMLFAEDLDWTLMVLQRGFWDTALHARPDYNILGNAILVWLGIQLAEWCSGDVFRVPQYLALVSYGFFAAATALPVLLLRRQLPAVFCWAAWLLACLLPLGIHAQPAWSGFEILGRAVNAGFLFLFIAFVLLWYRNTAVRTFAQALPVDLGLFVCAATNPICIALLPAAGWPTVRRWLGERMPLGRLLREGALVSLCLLAVACIAVNGLPTSRPAHTAAVSPVVGIDGAVEMTLARGMLYPFVWPIYRKLETWSTLLIAVIATAAAWRWVLPRHRAAVIAGIATVGLVSAVLVLRRGELAGYLGGYQATFPDRYFFGQNLVASLVMVVVLADLAERLRGRPRLAWLPAGALAALAIGAAVHEPLWKVAGSQFLLTDDGAIERTASRGLRDGCFVNASGHPDPEGAFIELAVPSFNDIRLRTITLPRRAVERSPAGRRMRIAATPPARL